jgi:hypothetical protein
MTRDLFAPNNIDPCVFDNMGRDVIQVTTTMHVDDLFVASASDNSLEKFENCMSGFYC